jgi:pyruvate carboxylase
MLGGATFDVAYRFLQECPWQRLRDLRAAMPNLMTQMLLRASNGVGYTNYPDNVVQAFVKQAANRGRCVPGFRQPELGRKHARGHGCGVDAGKICEGTICYTGDILDPDRAKYDLKYYVAMAAICVPQARMCWGSRIWRAF